MVFIFCFRYAKYVDLEKNVLATEEDELIHKVLTDKKAKRKHSIDDENEGSSAMITTTEIETEPLPIDENDLKWAANYIEEQQTQLILSLLNDGAAKTTDNDDDDDIVDDDKEEQTKVEDYKSLRPTLENMGIGKLFVNNKHNQCKLLCRKS
jgi:hypothetical protein